jgi:uracil-DNA glycosylase family 4
LPAPDSLNRVREDLIACTRCPRLRRYCEQVARVKRRAYRHESYWGKPVPSFGDPRARLLIIGLAPAAHGGNRTGRIFTGDRSGDFLFAALHRAGFANQPTSVHRDDSLRLTDVYITAAIHCAPPGNKPNRREFDRCRDYLVRENRLLTKVRVVVALGKIAFDEYLKTLKQMGRLTQSKGIRFRHGARYVLGKRASGFAGASAGARGVCEDLVSCLPQRPPDTVDLPVLLASYHPSQQNTQTGRLTASMLDKVFSAARNLLV